MVINKQPGAYEDLLTTLGLQNIHNSVVLPHDRRCFPRYRVKQNCTYHAVSQLELKQATLCDISQSGLCISCSEEIDVTHPLSILVESEESPSLPWAIRATVVRDTGIIFGGLHHYGCQIKSITQPDMAEPYELLTPRSELWDL